MHIFLHIVLLTATILLQLTIIPLFAVGKIAPDLLLVVVVASAVRRGRVWGVVTGFSSGLILDMFGSGMLGLTSLANSIAAFLMGHMANEKFETRIAAILGMLFATFLVRDLLYFVILLLGTAAGFWRTLFLNVVPHAFYTLVLAALLYKVFPRMLFGASRD